LERVYQRYDFTRFEDCLKATRHRQTVFLCASQSAGANSAHLGLTDFIRADLAIHTGLLQASQLNDVERVIVLSSATVYQPADRPLREDELDWNAPPDDAFQAIGWMKRYIEQLARFYHVQQGIKIGIVRPTSVYGPLDEFEEPRVHVVPSLIRRAMDKADPFVVWGTGEDVRDFLYVEDLVDDLIEVMERGCLGEPINLGSGCPMSIREVVDVILSVCGHPVVPVFDPSRPRTSAYRAVDTTTWARITTKRTRTSFAEGVHKTMQWYAEAMPV
jgi:GDP-L-fucose synthase